MRHSAPFVDRAHAGGLLAARLGELPLHHPVVLAIPRGGLEVAAPIARMLHAELDVVLARKLGAPGQPELAVGALSEDGEVWLDPRTSALVDEAWLEAEIRRESDALARRRSLLRAIRPKAAVANRSVIVVDDGLATGSTMIACLRAIRHQSPRELVAAIPVAPPDRLAPLRGLCTTVICLLATEDFMAVGQFYERFEQVSDERAAEILRAAWEADGGSLRQGDLRSP